MSELKPCPFCGGKARISFADVEFGGINYFCDRKVKYRFQVICNKCHSRGRPIKTDWLINCNPWLSNWTGRNYNLTQIVEEQTEMVRPWAEKAIEEWNRRVGDE